MSITTYKGRTFVVRPQAGVEHDRAWIEHWHVENGRENPVIRGDGGKKDIVKPNRGSG